MQEDQRRLTTINTDTLPKHFEATRLELQWDRQWEEWGIYRYDESKSREETFVVDTPPPTVSGSLHIGHVFSYTQTDVVVRYQRMLGRNIFYPMGWDDNGLPTERRVQNYFQVRCDPHTHYQPGLTLTAATAEELKQPPRIVSRPNFIELCLQLTHEDEIAFKALWRRAGLSVDWQQEYSTIDDMSRRIAQLSFLDLYHKGHVYSREAPTMWDVDFQTAVAQAEVEDRKLSGHFFHIRFGIENTDQGFVIATTRPELLPACVGITAHPNDDRYQQLFGKRAITPLFQVPVPIFASELVDPEKGTGILMVCTFGDATDIAWWRERGLVLRQIIGRDGRLLPITFGSEGWQSLDSESANRYYQQLTGKTVKTAQKLIAEMLRNNTSGESILVAEPKPIEHSVKFFEKGDKPLEFITTRQWFVRLLDKKEQLIALGNKIDWWPDFMRSRYRNWTENLQLDWCISRQRYFGVSFPVWYRLDEVGNPDMDNPILADDKSLPIDPMNIAPPGFEESQRDKPNGFTGEPDVFDTWFTSSMSPQIGSHWLLDPVRHSKLFPMDVRPQSHEIIRTWAFYTIVKALLHENQEPWKNALISGWILDPDRKKMSKSRGNVVTPMHLIEEYGADSVRYWAGNARLGTDTAFDEKVFKIGRRLVTKIYNASKFVLSQVGYAEPISYQLDRAFLARLQLLVAEASDALEKFDYAGALYETERFFWNSLTDSYLELVKLRARDSENRAGSGSAIMTLRLGLNILLRLFAPFLPYITEEVWSWIFANETGHRSIHSAPWPSAADFENIEAPLDTEVFTTAVACWDSINKRKSESDVSIGREVEHLTISANRLTVDRLKSVASDVMAAARALNYQINEDDLQENNTFVILDIKFASIDE
ncbi:MAG: valine--tRNA ligase [Acidobacteriota bacterium]